MNAHESQREVIRLCGRHLAKACGKLESMGCPEKFLEITRQHFRLLKSDLLSEKFTPSQLKSGGRKKVRVGNVGPDQKNI